MSDYQVTSGRIGNGKVYVDITDPIGQVTRRIADVAAATMEKAVREELIRLGWTPPPGPARSPDRHHLNLPNPNTGD